MCIEIKKMCECGRHNVQLHMRDNIMSKEVIAYLYCPACSTDVEFDYQTMLNDNGWIIEYDLELAKFFGFSKLKIDPDFIQPDFLFDERYATWFEIYPGEKKDILEERQEIMELIKEDKTKYLIEMNRWNIARINRLKTKGWRKLQHS